MNIDEMNTIRIDKAVRADFLLPTGFVEEYIQIPEKAGLYEGSFRDVEISREFIKGFKNHNIKLFVNNEGAIKHTLAEGTVVIKDKGTNEPLCVIKDNTLFFAFDPTESIRIVLEEKYFSPTENLFMKMPFHHHKVPGILRFAISKIIYLVSRIKKKSVAFPAWPDENSLDAFRYAIRSASGSLSNDGNLINWPKGNKFTIILSHDIDTDHGIKGAEKIAEMEKSMGITSCWNIPCTVILKNRAFVEELIADGHEVAIHGYNHDNRFANLPENEMRERYLKCVDVAEQIGARGFRAPSLLISDDLYKVLQEYFLWSSSTIDTDVNTIIGPSRGCSTSFPFYRGNILEIPLTVPFEDKLMLMGKKCSELQKTQIDKINSVSETGGVVMYGNHTEPHLSGRKDLLKVYENILEHIVSMNNPWITLPSEVEKFWRKLFPLE